MARLREYTGGSDGSLAVTPQQNVPAIGDGIGAGMEKLSAGLNKVSAYMMYDQQKADERALAEAKADQALLVRQSADQLQTRATTILQEEVEAAGVEGFGIAEKVRKRVADEARAQISEKFPLGANDPKITSAYASVVEANTRVALQQETQIRTKWRSEMIGSTVSKLSANLAANPDNWEAAKAEFNNFIDTAVYTSSPKAKEDLRTDGLTRLQRATMDGVAQRNGGVPFIRAFDGVVVGTPRQVEAPAEVKQSIAAAEGVGYNGNRIAAIGKLESDLNPNMGSMAGTSTPSSAYGMFQVLAGNSRNAVATRAALGVTQEDVLSNNYGKIAAGLSQHIIRESEKLKAAGINPTPGTDYMIWNIGPAATKAIMTANPNERVEDVLARVWGGSMSPAELQRSLTNNPGMYKPGMSVGQVRANYEGKMAGAMKSTEYLVTGETSLKSDDQARAVLAQVMPPGSFENLTLADVAPAYAKVKAAQKAMSEADLRLQYADSVLQGRILPMPFDSNYQKSINERFAPIAHQIHAGIITGDTATYAQTRALAETTKMLPQAHVTALRETVLSGDLGAKSQAYKLLSDLDTERRATYDASKIDDETDKRVKEYRAYTTFLNMNPAQAIQRIEKFRQGDGKQADRVMSELLDGSKGKKGELDDITWNTVTKALGDGFFSFAPGAVNDVQQKSAVEAVQTFYRFHRLEGQTKDAAMALALDEFGRGWGVSRNSGSKMVMPNPPEKYYGEIDGSHEWIKTEAQNQIANYAIAMGLIKTRSAVDPNTGKFLGSGPGGADATTVAGQVDPSKIEYLILSDAQTTSEVNAKRPPSYMLAFKVPDKNGVPITHVLPDRFDLGQAHTNAMMESMAANVLKADEINRNRALGTTADQRVLLRTPGAPKPSAQ